ncbi:MAG: 2OG-Fe(II) oxygenase [Myxococcales bacterium]|nr:2OG-Fe(II) oxygenase [Myxococcales bacterium]
MLAANLDLHAPLVWTVDGVLSASECAEQIARIEALGPEAATINARGGPVLDPGTRNNDRVIFDDFELAARLFARVRPHLPARMMGKRVVSANERFRGYRYRVGQRFAPHYDGSFQRSPRERSLLTFMIYLNDDFQGGETDFLELRQTIKPRAGQALLFQHFLLHEGCVLKQGTKYALRSDILYREED